MLNVALTLLLAGVGSIKADVHYVDLNSTSATPPYTNWTTAATNIQDAVDAAAAGDEVVVTNGVYGNGGRAINGTTNRVAAEKPLALRSVNGPDYTTIDGGGSNRCVYLTNSASLIGFTLTRGGAAAGGGAFCESATATVSNCVIANNRANGGAGVWGGTGGTLQNCTLRDNIVWNEVFGSGSVYALEPVINFW